MVLGSWFLVRLDRGRGPRTKGSRAPPVRKGLLDRRALTVRRVWLVRKDPQIRRGRKARSVHRVRQGRRDCQAAGAKFLITTVTAIGSNIHASVVGSNRDGQTGATVIDIEIRTVGTNALVDGDFMFIIAERS